VVLAHWPGQVSPWYDDLRRIFARLPVLGKFVTINEYLAHTNAPGHLTKFTADQYRAPYLKQAVIRRQADPLSRLANHHRRRAQADACQAVGTLTALLTGRCAAATNLVDAVEEAAAGTSDPPDLDRTLADGGEAAASAFAAAIPRGGKAVSGYLVANPLSFARRINVPVPRLEGRAAIDAVVRAFQDGPAGKFASVDVPAMGFAWVGASPAATAGRKGTEKPMAEELKIHNEHMEVGIDATGGGVRTIYDFRTRGNRMSQQLAFRLPGPRPQPGSVWRDPDEEARYTVMKAESVEVTSPGPVLGEITSRGSLLDEDGRSLAGFTQRTQLWRGWPVLVLEIELDVREEPRADPWNSYYAARFAWGDAGAELRRGVAGCGQPTDAKRLEAPHFIDVEGEKTRTSILAGGQPYHRRIGMRMLDALLVVRGESARRFRLGIGIDLPHPALAAQELLSPALAVAEGNAPPSSGPSGWLFHIDLKNVLATHWEPLAEDDRVVGFRARLLETAGRAGRARLQAFKPIQAARHVDFLGQALAQLTLDEGAVLLDFTAHEWIEVEVHWA
jgi:alpha-mannosidase